MTNEEAVATLRDRLAQAERSAEQMRIAGTQEQYLEAYFRVTALELRLDRLLDAIRRRI